MNHRKRKTAKQLLRKIVGTEGNDQRLAEAYGVGPLFGDGDRVRLTETPYGSVHEGTLILDERQKRYTGTTRYGVWTIRHDDGTLFRSEGRLEAIR